MLVQRRHLDIGAEPDAAAIRWIGAGQHFDQRRLARAIGPDDADAVAALNTDREGIDDLAVTIGAADALGLDDEPAGFFGFRRGKAGVAGGAAIVAALLTQRVQIAKPFNVALAASGDAVTQPMFFVDDLAIELVLLALFFGQHLVAPGLEACKAAIDLLDLAAIEPGSGTRQVGQKAAVVADDDQRTAAAVEFALQPLDGGEIQMVGRLVQEQDVGRRRQHTRECRAPRFAAGEMSGVLVAV